MVITIRPDGSLDTIYRDELRSLFDKLGDVHLERASNVDYVNGFWWVYRDGVPLINHGFYFRADAIKAEIEFLEQEK